MWYSVSVTESFLLIFKKSSDKGFLKSFNHVIKFGPETHVLPLFVLHKWHGYLYISFFWIINWIASSDIL